MEYAVNDKYRSVNLADIQLHGKIAKLMDTFFYERVTSEYAQKTIYQETEDAFRNQLDDINAVGIWQGEYWGKWMIGAVRVCRYYQSEELKTFIAGATRNLMTMQREDGYIGT